MLIAGAKGFAKEVLEVLNQNNALEDIVFFDDYTSDIEDKLFDTFKILKTIEEARDYFGRLDKRFTLGLGNPRARHLVTQKLVEAGGELYTCISPKADIGGFGITIGPGSNIMTGVILTSEITIGSGCLLNLNCTIGHDSKIGDFVELSPDVNISGRCRIGSFTSIGTSATVIPDVVIGKNCVVAAGAVVINDVADNTLVAGVPAVVKKRL